MSRRLCSLTLILFLLKTVISVDDELVYFYSTYASQLQSVSNYFNTTIKNLSNIELKDVEQSDSGYNPLDIRLKIHNNYIAVDSLSYYWEETDIQIPTNEYVSFLSKNAFKIKVTGKYLMKMIVEYKGNYTLTIPVNLFDLTHRASKDDSGFNQTFFSNFIIDKQSISVSVTSSDSKTQTAIKELFIDKLYDYFIERLTDFFDSQIIKWEKYDFERNMKQRTLTYFGVSYTIKLTPIFLSFYNNGSMIYYSSEISMNNSTNSSKYSETSHWNAKRSLIPAQLRKVVNKKRDLFYNKEELSELSTKRQLLEEKLKNNLASTKYHVTSDDGEPLLVNGIRQYHIDSCLFNSTIQKSTKLVKDKLLYVIYDSDIPSNQPFRMDAEVFGLIVPDLLEKYFADELLQCNYTFQDMFFIIDENNKIIVTSKIKMEFAFQVSQERIFSIVISSKFELGISVSPVDKSMINFFAKDIIFINLIETTCIKYKTCDVKQVRTVLNIILSSLNNKTFGSLQFFDFNTSYSDSLALKVVADEKTSKIILGLVKK